MRGTGKLISVYFSSFPHKNPWLLDKLLLFFVLFYFFHHILHNIFFTGNISPYNTVVFGDNHHFPSCFPKYTHSVWKKNPNIFKQNRVKETKWKYLKSTQKHGSKRFHFGTMRKSKFISPYSNQICSHLNLNKCKKEPIYPMAKSHEYLILNVCYTRTHSNPLTHNCLNNWRISHIYIPIRQ